MRKVFLFLVCAVSLMQAAETKSPTITPYGMAMYRLRYDFIDTIPGNDLASKFGGNYSNRIAYKLGVKATVNEEVSLQLEIGNDWFSTEEVDISKGNLVGTRSSLSPYFTLAFAQWDPGFMHIVGGIIPVKGTATLDLLGNSLLKSTRYFEAAHRPWGVVTNAALPALRVGAPILKNDFKLGVDFLTSVVTQRSVSRVFATDTFNYDTSAVLYMVEAPMSIEKLSFTPQFIGITNRIVKNHDSANGEILFGLDLQYKLNDAANFRGGFGMGMNSNEDALSKSDTNAYSRSGLNFNLGSSIKFTSGKLDVDLSLSTESTEYKNKPSKDATIISPFLDVKYGHLLNKNFIIMPRTRVFVFMYENDAAKIRIWPELIFTGNF